MPKVSVIVPAYNAAHFLPAALDSVLRQTWRDWEIVVADDGSTDDTRSVVEQRIPSFGGRLRYLFQPNRGVSAARNAALHAATGQFIALLDADDVWLPTRLERGMDVFDRDRGTGLVHARVLRMDPNGTVLGTPPSPHPKFLNGMIASHLYTRRAHVLCPTVLLRRECLDSAGCFDEQLRSTEDRDLWFRITRLFSCSYIDEPLAYYRVGQNSLSRDWQRSWDSQVQFLDKHRKTGAATLREYRQALANMHRERGDLLFNRHELESSIRSYAAAVSHDPLNVPNAYMLVRALGEPFLSKLRSASNTI
jgi:glycosyltransferase involved in cell wall biosynthesis